MRIHANITERTLRRTFREPKYRQRPLIVIDHTLPAFGFKAAADDTRTFFVRVPRELGAVDATLGSAENLAAETRDKAIAEIETAKAERRTGSLFWDFADELMRRQSRRWKPATRKRNRSALRNRILPFFGAMRVADIARADMQRWFDSPSAAPGNANRALPVLSVMMTPGRAVGYPAPGFQSLPRHAPRHAPLQAEATGAVSFGGRVETSRLRARPFGGRTPRKLSRQRSRRQPNTRSGTARSRISGCGCGVRVRVRSSGVKSFIVQVRPGTDAQAHAGTLPRDKPRRGPQGSGNSIGPHLDRRSSSACPQGQASAVPRLRRPLPRAAQKPLEAGLTVGRLLGHRRRTTTAIHAHLDDGALRNATAQAASVIARAMKYKGIIYGVTRTAPIGCG